MRRNKMKKLILLILLLSACGRDPQYRKVIINHIEEPRTPEKMLALARMTAYTGLFEIAVFEHEKELSLVIIMPRSTRLHKAIVYGKEFVNICEEIFKQDHYRVTVFSPNREILVYGIKVGPYISWIDPPN